MSDPSITGFLNWHDAEGGTTVRIAHDVVRPLTIEIMRGFGVTRRRGTEAGGILMGEKSADGRTVTVDGFEVVPCEYAFGPSYVLSPNDQPVLDEAVGRPGRSVIGYFRSHTREGAITPDETDARQFAAIPGAALALLIKPFATKPPVASLFFPLRGTLPIATAVREFTFSARVGDIKPIHPLPEPPLQPAPVTVAAPDRHITEDQRLLSGVLGPAILNGQPPEPRRIRLPRTTLLMGILYTAMVIITSFVTGFRMARSEAVFPLKLEAETSGGQVGLSWLAGSPTVRSSLDATLFIEENGSSRQQTLTASQLQRGSISIPPGTATVLRLRLELRQSGGRSVAETVVWTRSSP